MTLGRRGFLQRLGVGLVAAPAAAKQIVDKAAADLAGVSVSGVSWGNPGPPSAHGTAGAPPIDPRKALRSLLSNAALREEYIAAMYERNRHVGSLDLDLATKRSFSLAAKVTYQRQRNVERQIEDESHADGPPWARPDQLIRKAASWFLG